MYCRVGLGDSSGYLLKLANTIVATQLGMPTLSLVTLRRALETWRVKNNFARDIRVYLREFPGRRVFPLMAPKLRNGLAELFD